MKIFNKRPSFLDVLKYHHSTFKNALFFITGVNKSARKLMKVDILADTSSEVICDNLYDFFELNKDLIILSMTDPERSFFKDKDNLIPVSEVYHLPGIVYNEFFYCFSNYEGRIGYIQLNRNVTKSKFFWEAPIKLNGIKSIIRNNFLSQKRNVLGLYTLSDGVELWEKEFSDNTLKMEVWKEEFILVELSSPTGNTIVSLGAENGAELWQKKGAKLKKIDERIFWVIHEHTTIKIVEYNPEESEVFREYDLTDVVLESIKMLAFFWYTVQNNMIYMTFTQEKTILVIDLEKSELTWKHTIDNDSEWIDEPKVAGNRLYVLDEQKTLHVFEEED